MYSVASYERPVRLLSSATPPSPTRATTVAPPFAASLADAKSDETTAGERRASVTTKDRSNSFGMWLPSAEADAQHNVQLLVRPWFDIPDGKRAIIAVAKDATGVRAFAQALAGWDGSAAAAAPRLPGSPKRSRFGRITRRRRCQEQMQPPHQGRRSSSLQATPSLTRRPQTMHTAT
jgi:hypothetical protein